VRTLLLRIAALVIIAVAVIADSGCSTTAAVQSAPPALVSVVTARAEVSDVPIEIRLPAIVEPHATVTVKSEIAGELRRVLVHEGQAIHRGDVLFEIEPEPYVAALNQAKAQDKASSFL